MNSSHILHECIKSVFEALAKHGLQGDAQVILSKHFSKEQVAQMMTQIGLEHLQDKVHGKGDFISGIQIKIENENLTLDLTDETVTQLILNFASDTLKKFIFNP